MMREFGGPLGSGIGGTVKKRSKLEEEIEKAKGA